MRITHAIAAATLLVTTVGCAAETETETVQSGKRAAGSLGAVTRDSPTAPESSSPAPESSSTGVIKMTNRERGYGFITADDSPLDVYFHHSGVSGAWPETGDAVRYEIEIVKGKVKAVNVRPR
ncbi:cold-shock protein [Nocardioides pacificus]